MKIKLLLPFLAILLSYSTCYASFPVKRTTVATTTNSQTVSQSTTEILKPVVTAAAKNKWVGVALWFFLGWPFAAHRWYYQRDTLMNILFIITFAGLGIWAIVDLINMLLDKW